MEKLYDRSLHSRPEKLRSKKTVLVIDDSEDNVMLSKILLELEGYEVPTACSGLEALVFLSTFPQVDLILLDMKLGDISGIDFLNILERQNKKVFENVPIVFVTGMDQVPKSQARDILRKPVDNAKLLETVKRLLNES